MFTIYYHSSATTHTFLAKLSANSALLLMPKVEIPTASHWTQLQLEKDVNKRSWERIGKMTCRLAPDGRESCCLLQYGYSKNTGGTLYREGLKTMTMITPDNHFDYLHVSLAGVNECLPIWQTSPPLPAIFFSLQQVIGDKKICWLQHFDVRRWEEFRCDGHSAVELSHWFCCTF